MQLSSIGALSPVALLIASFIDWSLISQLFFLTFLLIQYKIQWRGFYPLVKPVLWKCVVILATVVILAEGVTIIIWVINGKDWKAPFYWFKLSGLRRFNPWQSGCHMIIPLASQILVIVTGMCALFHDQSSHSQGLNHIAGAGGTFQLYTMLRCIVLPSVQIAAGVAHLSWIALPYFVCSCIGLFHWCMTRNIVRISWGWKALRLYTGLNILILYSYQLPIVYPPNISKAAEYVGIFTVSHGLHHWSETVQGLAILLLYVLLCVSIHEVEDLDESHFNLMCLLPTTCNSGHSVEDGCLRESLLPYNSSFQKEIISLRFQGDGQRQHGAFQLFSINLLIYGFPVCLVALVLWSFAIPSLCAFILLLYVGYTLYAFPSVRVLYWLNVALLCWILLWGLSTYIFNVAFTLFGGAIEKNAGLSDMIGLHHYSVPGLFLLVQFSLAVIIGANIFASNAVLGHTSLPGDRSSDDQNAFEEKQDIKILVVAIVAWCIHRSAHLLSLVLLFIIGVQHGLIYTIYMLFFFMHLLKPEMAARTRKSLIILCEFHFGILYLFQLDMISHQLGKQPRWIKTIFYALGLLKKAGIGDFMRILALLCFNAVQNHGFKCLHSVSSIVQESPCPPLGFGILKARRSRSVLLSVFAPCGHVHLQQDNNTTVNWVTQHISDAGEAIRAIYRSFGTYITFFIVLLVVYSMGANYISFGYFVLLLFWIIGRQLVGTTRSFLWFPLFIYSGMVFVFYYILSCFPDLQRIVEKKVPLYPDLGFKSTSTLEQLWDSLVVLVLMQLFRFERVQQSEQIGLHASGAHVHSNNNFIGLLKRLLILHSNKVLSITVFYASISPVSVMGFPYIIILVLTSSMSKVSGFPARMYALYTAIVAICQFIFLILGGKMELLPSQVHGAFSFWLGFRVFEKSFWGMESGFRSKALVIVSCMLRYSSLYWLECLPASLRKYGWWEDPCFLFPPFNSNGHDNNQSACETEPLLKRAMQNHQEDGVREVYSAPNSPILTIGTEEIMRSHSLQDNIVSSKGTSVCTGLNSTSNKGEVIGASLLLSLSSPSTKESRQWSKKVMLVLRKERYDAQLRTLTIYFKYIMENFFCLYGLEISMLVLLVASFALLNIISLFYMVVLGLCIILRQKLLRSLWAFFVVLFAGVLLVEYVALGKGPPSWDFPDPMTLPHFHCHDCWRGSPDAINYCTTCWLGFVVDDRQMLVAYFMVFIVACFKLHSDLLLKGDDIRSFHYVLYSPIDRIAWKEISYETKGQWTWLDHLRFFYYRHLLDIVLILLLITGTLQYDVLHFGYLAFALVFFRMRDTILKQKNYIFQYLRLYNFLLITISLLYQAPFLHKDARHTAVECVYDVVGLTKFAYGFNITSRSAIVDITIFCVVGLQSSIFCSKEFSQILRYLEAEEVDAKLQAQEKKAEWKKKQLQCIREMEERKCHRRWQVEKMKREMHNLQLDVDVLNSPGKLAGTDMSLMTFPDRSRDSRCVTMDMLPPLKTKANDKTLDFTLYPSLGKHIGDAQEPVEFAKDTIEGKAEMGIRKRKIQFYESPSGEDFRAPHVSAGSDNVKKLLQKSSTHSCPFEIHDQVDCTTGSLVLQKSQSLNQGSSSRKQPLHRLRLGVQILGDGVAQVQKLGNKALKNILGLLNIDLNDSVETEKFAAEKEAPCQESDIHVKEDVLSSCTDAHVPTKNFISDHKTEAFGLTYSYLCMICGYCFCKIRLNIDIVCYFFFLLVFIWNYSLLTLVYPAALFLYALFANPGPNQRFWLGILIYTELNILIQYMYQIRLHHCECKCQSHWLTKLGIPAVIMNQSFVISVLPLCLVYFATLLQSSIIARDGEWMSVSNTNALLSQRMANTMNTDAKISCIEIFSSYFIYFKEYWQGVGRGFLRYFKSLIHGSEAPPHFVQVSMLVKKWPKAGIQPERIESSFNKLLRAAHQKTCQVDSEIFSHFVSCIRIESIESNQNKYDTAIAVLEVIYASPQKQCLASGQDSSLTPAEDVALEILKAKDAGLVEETEFPYPILSVIAGGKREVDLYAYIFGTDLITFFIVALFYQSVIKNSPELLQMYQVEDQFPKEFVFVLMTLFFLIIVDRIIYLCSFAVGKVIYYYFNLFLFTYYVIHYAWQIKSDNNGSGVFLLRVFYLTKALSLSFLALQMKHGLPHKSSLFRQFLTKSVTNLNYIGFRLYRSLPFLFELRCILDWSCTMTALTMYDWLKLEDIYASLYLVQCDAKLSRETHQQGERQGFWTKFFSGICLFLCLICVIWAPMLMYSSGNPTNIANPVFDVQMQIDLTIEGGQFTLYKTSVCKVSFLDDAVKAGFSPGSFLDPYDIRDVQIVCCHADADFLWLVPSPTIKTLMDSFSSESVLISKWIFTRQRPKTRELATYTNPTNETSRSDLQKVLNGTENIVQVSNLYPSYFRITGTGEVHILEEAQSLKQTNKIVSPDMVSGNLTLKRETQSWWSFTIDNSSFKDGCGNINGPAVITVSEEVPQGLIGDTLSKFSIVSLYITFVLALGRFIRLQCADLRMRIPYENLPSCDRLIAICEDIYAARAARELTLEEGLFWTLVKIYRSPHALLEYTKSD